MAKYSPIYNLRDFHRYLTVPEAHDELYPNTVRFHQEVMEILHVITVIAMLVLSAITYPLWGPVTFYVVLAVISVMGVKTILTAAYRGYMVHRYIQWWKGDRVSFYTRILDRFFPKKYLKG